MAGSKDKAEKAKAGKSPKPKKVDRHISDQLEEKFVGTRTEVFSRISIKEAEIRTKTSAERAKAERLIEDAKGQAATIKRKATLEEIGKDLYTKIIDAAREEVGEIEKATARDIAEVEKTGEKNLELAVDFIVGAVIATGKSAARPS
jgi:vacuolar-type H+-ATPase subunit H